MILRRLVLVLAAATGAFGLIEFDSPTPGQSATLVDDHLDIRWSGDVDGLAEYQLVLMAGGSTEATSGHVADVDGDKPLSSGVQAQRMPVSMDAGPDLVNAYYIKMLARRTDGGAAVFYSGRFAIHGMHGTFPPSYTGETSKSIQAAWYMVKNDVAAVPENTELGPYLELRQAAAGQPYSMQTEGNVKYAPMQGPAPTQITKRDTDRLYPSTKVNLARSPLPLPKFVNTVTQAVTYKASSKENQASPAPQPQDDMAKFLARWKD